MASHEHLGPRIEICKNGRVTFALNVLPQAPPRVQINSPDD